MRPCYVKRRCKCRAWCGKPIEKGEEAVQEYFRTKKGYWVKVHFHWLCMIEKTTHWFDTHTPESEQRNKKSLYPDKTRRLQSLRIYHLKMGHTERVAELDGEIKRLKI